MSNLSDWSWKRRACALLSAIWLLLAFLISTEGYGGVDTGVFVVWGLIPLLILWGTAWVLSTTSIYRALSGVRWGQIGQGLVIIAVSAWTTANYLIVSEVSHEPTLAAEIGYLVGYVGLYSFLLALLLRLFAKIKLKFNVILLTGLVFIFGSIYQAGVGYYSSIHHQAEKLFLQDVSEIIKRGSTGYSLVDYKIKTPNEQHIKLLKVIIDEAESNTNAVNNFLVIIDSKEFTSLLEPEVLLAASEIPSSIGVVKSSLNLLRETNLSFYSNLDSHINMLDIDDNLKKSFLDGFSETKLQSIEQLEDFYRIESAILAAVTDIYKHILKTQPTLSPSGDMILFEDQSDVTKYNKLLAYLNDFASKEAIITREFIARRERALREIQERLE